MTVPSTRPGKRQLLRHSSARRSIPASFVGLLAKIALMLVALPASCLLLCAARVEPIHGFMMRNDCPIAKWTMNKPLHPMERDGQAMIRAR